MLLMQFCELIFPRKTIKNKTLQFAFRNPENVRSPSSKIDQSGSTLIGFFDSSSSNEHYSQDL